MSSKTPALTAVATIAAALFVAAIAGAPDPAHANVWRNEPWKLPPPGVKPQITITYFATGGAAVFCYGSPQSHFVGGRNTWWCFAPDNSLVGYLHADQAEFTLFRQNMARKCRYFYVADMEQPQSLPQGTYGWNGRGECAGEGPYNIGVRWSE